MKALQDSCKGMREDVAITAGDRAHFVKRAAWAAAAVVVGAEGVGMSPAAADRWTIAISPFGGASIVTPSWGMKSCHSGIV